MEGKAGAVLSFLLDTDVVSQLSKETPHPLVLAWLAEAAVSGEKLYLSVVNIQEMREGIERLTAGKKKASLDRWLREDILRDFDDYILPVTIEIADLCGRIIGRERAQGFHPGIADAYVAATARVHGLTIATLNRTHFERLGAELVEF